MESQITPDGSFISVIVLYVPVHLISMLISLADKVSYTQHSTWLCREQLHIEIGKEVPLVLSGDFR